MRRTREAAADGGGDSGMRLRGELGPRVVVVVVVEEGMLAMTVASTDSGDTPSVAGEQPVRERIVPAAIAPARERVGGIMSIGKAERTPSINRDDNCLSHHSLGRRQRPIEPARRPRIGTTVQSE